MHRRTLGLLLACLLLPGIASSQIPVTDAGNAALNLVTSIQSTISAVEDVAQTAYMVLEITPLDDIAIASDYAETIALLGQLLKEGTGLMGDAQQAKVQIQALFGLGNVPNTPVGLNERMAAMHEVITDARIYAVRVQTLVSSLQSAMSHIVQIVEIIGALSGNMQSNQSMVQLLAVQNATTAIQTTQAAAMQRVDILERAEKDVIRASLARIDCERWLGWPGMERLTCTADGGVQ